MVPFDKITKVDCEVPRPYLLVNGKKYYVIAFRQISRGGSESPCLMSYQIHNGRWTVPVMWRWIDIKYGGGWFNFIMTLYYRPSLIKKELEKPGHIFNAIKGKDTWTGGKIAIPFTG